MKRQPVNIGKTLTAYLMLLAIILLTTSNFFVYAPQSKSQIAKMANVDEDEKASDSNEKAGGSSLSIVDEIFHHHHFDFLQIASSQLFLHRIHVAQKLAIIPIDLLSPPPEL